MSISRSVESISSSKQKLATVLERLANYSTKVCDAAQVRRVIEAKDISNRRTGGQRDAKFQRSFVNRAVGFESEGLRGDWTARRCADNGDQATREYIKGRFRRQR